eukprot:COSAG01_NODE_29095_length_645_cov_1.393773_1_plen_54_part_01
MSTSPPHHHPVMTRDLAHLRVRVEMMRSQKCGIVSKSQSFLMMIHPMIFTRTHT